ncbi:MAG: hypothetical protein HUK00_10240, partial [Bacteroidaceae bacterium]|nr:hypothetical protein [Bacteroidaceae bacterium]
MRTEPRRAPRENRFGGDDIEKVITEGVVFRSGPKREADTTKSAVKT